MGRIQILLTGAHRPGDVNNSLDKLPDWFSREQFDKGRRLIHENSCSNYFSTNIGVVLVSQLTSLMEPLIETGNVCSIVRSQSRVARTFQYVLSWNEGNVFDPDDVAHKNLRKVRLMHKKVAEQLNKNKPTSHCWISQLDMALTQFSIIGPMMLFPKKIGVYLNEEDLGFVAYFWRTIGYLLGLEDDYNLCSGSYQEIHKLCWDIVEVIIKPSLSHPHPIYTECLYNGITGLRKFASFIDYAAFVNWSYELIGMEERLPITLYGKICILCWKGTVNGLYYDSLRKTMSPFYRKTVNTRINDHLRNLETANDKSSENIWKLIYSYLFSIIGVLKKVTIPRSFDFS